MVGVQPRRGGARPLADEPLGVGSPVRGPHRLHLQFQAEQVQHRGHHVDQSHLGVDLLTRHDAGTADDQRHVLGGVEQQTTVSLREADTEDIVIDLYSGADRVRQGS